MNTIVRYGTALALIGAAAFAVSTPSEARHGRNAALIGGLAAGAVIGAAAAGAANNGYYYGPGYDSGYGGGYAYEPAPVYAAPSYGYGSSYGYRDNYRPPCAIDMGNRLDYSAC